MSERLATRLPPALPVSLFVLLVVPAIAGAAIAVGHVEVAVLLTAAVVGWALYDKVSLRGWVALALLTSYVDNRLEKFLKARGFVLDCAEDEALSDSRVLEPVAGCRLEAA